MAENTPIPTIEELSASMEKMYHEHNAQIVTLSRMITTLGRLAGYDAKQFAQEVKNDPANRIFADAFNQSVDETIEETENGKS